MKCPFLWYAGIKADELLDTPTQKEAAMTAEEPNAQQRAYRRWQTLLQAAEAAGEDSDSLETLIRGLLQNIAEANGDMAASAEEKARAAEIKAKSKKEGERHRR